jgi:hypothetical protein
VNLLHGLETAAPPFLFLTFLGVGLVSGLILMAFVSAARR